LSSFVVQRQPHAAEQLQPICGLILFYFSENAIIAFTIGALIVSLAQIFLDVLLYKAANNVSLKIIAITVVSFFINNIF